MGVGPDIILYTRRRGEDQTLADYLKRPSFAALKVVREDEVHELPSAGFLIPSPRVVEGVERLELIFTR